MKTKKTKKYMMFNDIYLDIEEVDDKTINGVVRMFLEREKGLPIPLFQFERTDNGYKYYWGRNLRYGINGNVIIDQDCSMIFGMPLEDFQYNPLFPEKKPVILGFAYRQTDGYYCIGVQVEELYKRFITFGDGVCVPKKVSINACDTFVKVEVTY